MAAPSLSMPLSKILEDQLPLAAPEAAHPLTGPSTQVHYSIYITTPLNPQQQVHLLSKINTNSLGSQTCRFAPEHPSPLGSVKEAYTHHLQHRNKDASIHPYLFFFFIDNKTCENVLLVNLKAPTERKDVRFVIGVLRCGIEEADLLACNFDIGNIDWIEGKESESGKWGYEGDAASVYSNPRYFPSDPPSSNAAHKQGSEIKRRRRRRYAWYSLIRGALRYSSKLEPTSAEKHPLNTTFTLAGSYHASNEPLEEIKKSFPYVCWMDERIHRNILLVLTSTDGKMEIYRALWDAENELARFPFQEGVEVREQPYLRAAKNLRTELELIKDTKVEGVWEAVQEMES